MTALAANANITRFVDTEIREWPVAASQHIYRNSFVGIDPAGNSKTFVPGDRFAGIAYEEADNSSGAAAAIKCRVVVEGDFTFALTSGAQTDDGSAVYATDDATISLSGHPDAFVGRILHLDPDTSAYVVIRMRRWGETPRQFGDGSLDLHWTGAEHFTATGAVAAADLIGPSGFRLNSALGLGVSKVDGIGATFDFDATAEIAHASIETAALFLASKGATFEADLHMTNTGAAANDFDWGLMAAITANSRLNMDHADATDLALFHMDAASNNILAQSDDGTTDVAAVDTTIDNVTTATTGVKKFKVIVRPTGVCEFWIGKARVLSTTVFAVATTAVLAGTVNLEKTSDAAVAVMRINRLRCAGVQA